MKTQADKNSYDRQFQVGEQVLLKLQLYAQNSVISREFTKLAFKYFRPFSILERIGAVAYKLQLPADCVVHPAFHIPQLKPYTPNYSPVFKDLTPISDLSVGTPTPVAILDRRLVKKGSFANQQLLVQWLTLSKDCTTWEDYFVLRTRFPDTAIWGPFASQGGGRRMSHRHHHQPWRRSLKQGQRKVTGRIQGPLDGQAGERLQA